MAGYSDGIYRRFARRFGADATFTEMVSADGLLYKSGKTLRMLSFVPSEEPVFAQFFTGKPDAMARAAEIARDMGFCGVDVNMGCSVRKVIRQGAGAALLLDPQKAKEIVAAAINAGIPVSVKVRCGFHSKSEWYNVLKMLMEFQSMGISFVTIHPRTAMQLFSGRADWTLLAEAVDALDIPVVGSGDLFTVENVADMVERTHITGIMLARGAIANFELFSQVRALFEGEEVPSISQEERAKTMLEFIKAEVKERGEDRAIRWCRKFLMYLFRSTYGASEMRRKIAVATSFVEVKKVIEHFIRSP